MWAGWSKVGSEAVSESDQTPVYLNVYDLTPMNGYVYWVGLGIFHSGIEAHGVEYAYGAHDYSTSGVFEVEPHNCPGFSYRNTVMLGFTDMGAEEFHSFIERCADEYSGDSYHLISKNCNHFSDDVWFRLTGKHVPGWVNRLARIGLACSCLLPESLQVTSVPEETTEVAPRFEEGTGHDLNPVVSTAMAGSQDEHEEQHLLKVPNGDLQSPA